MLFPTLTFGIFFLIVYTASWLLRGSNEWRKILILVASWVFYGWWDVKFVALLIASGLLNWGLGRLIVLFDDRPGPRKLAFALGIAANLAILAPPTYFRFLLVSCGDAVAR